MLWIPDFGILRNRIGIGRKMVPLMIMTLLSAAMPGDEQDAEAGVGGWRLANSPSAYLREHSENPVEWHPWGDAAFEEARKLDRPVFLSIGYSSCHWCHVMRRESFSDEAIAAYLNANFISIKVDREDLPHVDEVYMDAVRAMTGGGGWPLSVFLFPDGKPFYGGTYFPPRQRFNRPGFLEISGSIIKAWNTDRGKMRESATGLLDHLSKRDQRQHEGQSMELFLGGGIQSAASSYTLDPPGFGAAPRFPSPRFLQFLVGEGSLSGDETSVKRAVSVLREMAAGGIYDQVAGGFHRYSVDAQWQVPHFEKMLYNQGSLAESYLEAGRITSDDSLLQIGRATLDAMLSQFQLQDGSFAGSWDADSGGVEGSYYVWTPEQVKETVAPESVELVCDHFGIEEEGNFEGGEASVPRIAMSLETAAKKHGLSLEEAQKRLDQAVSKMLKVRDTRVAPKRDDKVVLGWNALAISGLARGATILDESRFREAAVRAYGALKGSLVEEERFLRRRDRHVSEKGEAHVVEGNPATLQDAALWMKSVLDLYEATFRPEFILEARRCWEVILKNFGPLETGEALYEAPEGAEILMGRRKDYFDGAIPSGNATTARNLLRLYELTGESVYLESSMNIVEAALSRVGPYPMGASELLLAVQALQRRVPVIVIAGDPSKETTQRMLESALQSKVPFSVVALRPEGEAGESAEKAIPLLEGRSSGEVEARAFVCIDQVCEVPLEKVENLVLRMDQLSREIRTENESKSSESKSE